MICRPATQSDAPDILAMTRAVGVFNAKEVACVEELLKTYLNQAGQDDYHFLSCVDGDRLVGFACYGPTPLTDGTFDLYWICAAPEHQRHGVGEVLLRQIEAEVQKRNGRQIFVETSATPVYAPARRFYEKHGFEPVAMLDDFYAVGDGKAIYRKNVC
jgi:ribosomal protein S18 acetylase RimI-like enzyme